jgi:hypothetical protein
MRCKPRLTSEEVWNLKRDAVMVDADSHLELDLHGYSHVVSEALPEQVVAFEAVHLFGRSVHY